MAFLASDAGRRMPQDPTSAAIGGRLKDFPVHEIRISGLSGTTLPCSHCFLVHNSIMFFSQYYIQIYPIVLRNAFDNLITILNNNTIFYRYIGTICAGLPGICAKQQIPAVCSLIFEAQIF